MPHDEPCYSGPPEPRFYDQQYKKPMELRVDAIWKLDDWDARVEAARRAVEAEPPDSRGRLYQLLDTVDVVWRFWWASLLSAEHWPYPVQSHSDLREWTRLQQRVIVVGLAARMDHALVPQDEPDCVLLDKLLEVLSRWLKSKMTEASVPKDRRESLEFSTRKVPKKPYTLEHVRRTVFQAWDFLRELRGADPPVQPADVPDAETAQNALDHVVQWCDRQKRTSTRNTGRSEAPTRVKEPSKRAKQIWQLKTSSEYYQNKTMTQSEIAELASRTLGRPISQGSVSKYLRSVNAFIKAGGLLDQVAISPETITMEPDRIDMGARADGRARRQRPHKSEDAE